MKIISTPMSGVKILVPSVSYDKRGYFFESFNQKKLFENAGIECNFVQENRSFSKKNVIRGLHFQYKFPQGKLLSVLEGCVFDVVVDLRITSPTFKKVFTVYLKDDSRQLWIPPGFAHGFKVISEHALLSYKVTEYWCPYDEYTILWNDPGLYIDWKINSLPIISEKDQEGSFFENVPKFL